MTAFAIYFVCVHAPAHTAALIRDPWRAPRVHDGRSAIRLALPIVGLTLLIGAALWPLYAGAPPERLLSLTLQGLACLTLPHMLFDAWLTRHERKELSFSDGATPGRDESRRPGSGLGWTAKRAAPDKTALSCSLLSNARRSHP